MARVGGLAGGAGLRGSEDGVGPAGAFLKAGQVHDADGRAVDAGSVVVDEVGDSATWGDGNSDVTYFDA